MNKSLVLRSFSAVGIILFCLMLSLSLQSAEMSLAERREFIETNKKQAIAKIDSELEHINQIKSSLIAQNIDPQTQSLHESEIQFYIDNLDETISLIQDHQFKNASDILSMLSTKFKESADYLKDIKEHLAKIIKYFSTMLTQNTDLIKDCSDIITSFITPYNYEALLEVESLMKNTISFSPDGSKLCASSTEYIQIWDANTKEELTKIEFPSTFEFMPISIVWSPDSTKILCLSMFHISCYDAHTGERLNYVNHELKYKKIAWINNIEIILIDYEGMLIGNALNFDLNSYKENNYIRKGQGKHYISPDRQLLVSYDGFDLVIFDIKTEKVLSCFEVNDKCERRYFKLYWSPDSTRIAFKHDEFIKILDVKTNKVITTIKTKTKCVAYQWHKNNGAIIWSSDSSKIASTDFGEGIMINDANSGDQLFMTNPAFLTQIFEMSPDGSKLAIYSGQYNLIIILTLINTENGLDIENELRINLDDKTKINKLYWAPNGKELVSVDSEGTLKIWGKTFE